MVTKRCYFNSNKHWKNVNALSQCYYMSNERNIIKKRRNSNPSKKLVPRLGIYQK